MADPIIILGEEKDVHLTDELIIAHGWIRGITVFTSSEKCNKDHSGTKPQSKNTKRGALLSTSDERAAVSFLWVMTLFPTEIYNAIHSRKDLNNHV